MLIENRTCGSEKPLFDGCDFFESGFFGVCAMMHCCL